MRNTAFKKKLHVFRPDGSQIDTQRTNRQVRRESCDSVSLERGVRQLLSDKVSGTMVGIWLLIPEYLRLGTWDLLQGWTHRPGSTVEPRLALQLVNEAALCRTGIRKLKSLSQKGFELANGLPFVATDQAIHNLLEAHTIQEAQAFQLALGRIRRVNGHFKGQVLAIDPHHMRSFTKRQARRHRSKPNETAVKTVQTFFSLDCETHQPLTFTCASSAKSVAQGTPALLDLAVDILQPSEADILVLADKEHFSAKIFQHVAQTPHLQLLTPIPNTKHRQDRMKRIPPENFTSHWAGFSTTTLPYQFQNFTIPNLYQIVQRCGETPDSYHFNSFLTTYLGDEVQALIHDFPQRWHVEEFFRFNQALGWNRGGTLNLHIRYGQMTMALMAQAAIHQLRQRLGTPFSNWEASHLADDLFNGLDGDIRVNDDTILVTFYNAPHVDALKLQYENLPQKLSSEKIDPRIPWLYNFNLDFRFK